ncbi:hydantoinase B/oxoprolinase family protein [Mesorhizobium captivum]|uniref:hydantoinase B/oxoprolinase family protein n=1 Tax=Mesorhizobium captivum TaxID=3072319 RepID=UPI002A24ED41|nr:hydantoinase B/oxoprolinase family protein [Mesorhizobium sp. VK22E]MDX8507270.1 hydantoinase B/oxoprolinase family protein [Mesorhizobium sp. VK22E]
MCQINAIDMEVFNNRLLSITDEVMNTLIRSSFSTNIKERKDASVAIFDRDGRLICQALYIPMLLSGVMGGVETLLKSRNIESFREGDVFICNDVYLAGGSHSNDIAIITPVFIDGRIEYFIGNIGHHSDVGGVVPGSTDHILTSVFAEGIRIPHMRIVREGVLDEDLLAMIAHNTRDPMERILDLKVQIAANSQGARSLRRLSREYGLSRVQKSMADLLTYTERRMRRRLEELPDGVYRSEVYTDDEGVPGPRKKICLSVRIQEGDVRLDFTGTDRQARGSINMGRYPLLAAVFCGINMMVDPSIPSNFGMFRPVRIEAPAGTIVNPEFPAAVGNREYTAQRVVRAITLAFAQALPRERAVAPSADINTGMAFYGKRRSGEPFVYVEAVAGGVGATLHKDGMHGTQVGITNTSNTPAEPLEIEFPLIVREYALATDTAGPGRTQGGAAIIRDIGSLVDGVSVSTKADGKKSPAPGIFGGGEGGRASLEYHRADGAVEEIEMFVVDRIMAKGDAVRLISPGGGGFGNPAERDCVEVARSLRDGFISSEFTAQHYPQVAAKSDQ